MATCKDCLNEKDCPYRMGEAELISVNEAVYENAEDLDKVDDVEALCQLFKDKNSYAKIKHGKWIKQDTSFDLCGVDYYKCSLCGKETQTRYTNCPWCTAKMDCEVFNQ